jgi:hypothetical protein
MGNFMCLWQTDGVDCYDTEQIQGIRINVMGKMHILECNAKFIYSLVISSLNLHCPSGLALCRMAVLPMGTYPGCRSQCHTGRESDILRKYPEFN